MTIGYRVDCAAKRRGVGGREEGWAGLADEGGKKGVEADRLRLVCGTKSLLCCWPQAACLGLAVTQSLNPHPPTQTAPGTRLSAGPAFCLLSSEQNREPARGCPFALHAAMDGISQ